MTYSAEVGSIPGQTEDGDVTKAATSSPPGSRPRSNGQVWAIALAFGLTAGLFAWGAEEATYGLFRPQLFPVVILRMPSLQPSRESQNTADIKNATLAFAFLGCLTGLAMGFAGGVAGRSPVRGMVVGVVAMLLGGLIAAGASLVLLPAFFRQLVPDPSDLLTPIMIHGGIWGAIGAQQLGPCRSRSEWVAGDTSSMRSSARVSAPSTGNDRLPLFRGNAFPKFPVF